MFAPEPLALILAPPKLVLTCAPRLVFATSPFIALLVRQASRLVRITKPSILIVTCQAFLFRSAPLLFVLPPQLVLSLPLLIKAASISLSLIASLKFGCFGGGGCDPLDTPGPKP